MAAQAPASPRILLLPGWQNSGAAHWQSRWEALYGDLRVEQHDWMHPLRGDWVMRLDEVVQAQSGDVVLVAHSLGCLLVAAWAAQTRLAARVRGALLVAPGDPQRPELAGVLHSWTPLVLPRLPFPSLLLGSHNDPFCSLERARSFADALGARWRDWGHAGHINADSGLGDWPQGRALLADFLNPQP